MIEGYFIVWRDNIIERIAKSRIRYPDHVPEKDVVAIYNEIESLITKQLLNYEKKGYEVAWKRPAAGT